MSHSRSHSEDKQKKGGTESDSENSTIRIDEYIRQKKRAAKLEAANKKTRKPKRSKKSINRRKPQWAIDLSGLNFNQSLAAILGATLKSFHHRNLPGCFHDSYRLMSDELLLKTCKEVTAALDELKLSGTQQGIISRIEKQTRQTRKLPAAIKEMIGVTKYNQPLHYNSFHHHSQSGWVKMYFAALKLHRIEYHGRCDKFSYGSATARKLKIQQSFLEMLVQQANDHELQQLEGELNNHDKSLSTLNSQYYVCGLFKNTRPIHHYKTSLKTALNK